MTNSNITKFKRRVLSSFLKDGTLDLSPKTMITLTKKGRGTFDTYRNDMENVLSQISN